MITKDCRDYHLEYVRIQSPRLPHNPEDFQCPSSDELFEALTTIMEACSFLKGSCNSCDFRSKCLEIHDALAERGSDKKIIAEDVLELTTLFILLRKGEVK